MLFGKPSLVLTVSTLGPKPALSHGHDANAAEFISGYCYHLSKKLYSFRISVFAGPQRARLVGAKAYKLEACTGRTPASPPSPTPQALDWEGTR